MNMCCITCLPRPGNEALSHEHAHFQRKRLKSESVKKNSRVFQEKVWVYVCTLPRDRDKLESLLLVPMNFWDKLHRPKLVNFFPVLH